MVAAVGGGAGDRRRLAQRRGRAPGAGGVDAGRGGARAGRPRLPAGAPLARADPRLVAGGRPGAGAAGDELLRQARGHALRLRRGRVADRGLSGQGAPAAAGDRGAAGRGGGRAGDRRGRRRVRRPQHALSLTGLARGVLSLVQAPVESQERGVADAMQAHPWHVAGTGRDDTELMGAVPGLLVKGGADGVHVAALPGRRAVALKLDDGGDRGRAPALSAGLLRLGVPAETLGPWLLTPVPGGGGVVGDVRPAASLRL